MYKASNLSSTAQALLPTALPYGPPFLQPEHPVLPFHGRAGIGVALGGDEGEAEAFVEPAGGDERIVRPQHHAAIPSLAREADRGLDETPAEAAAACGRVDEEQAELRIV